MRLPHLHPPQNLLESVLLRVAAQRRSAARREFLMLAGVACASTLLLVPALRYASHELYASGFSSYLSLLFSDGSVLISSREFILSLMESLPVLALGLVLAAGGALLWSLARGARRARAAFGSFAF